LPDLKFIPKITAETDSLNRSQDGSSSEIVVAPPSNRSNGELGVDDEASDDVAHHGQMMMPDSQQDQLQPTATIHGVQVGYGINVF
jgi:hypothetical protein